jgi:hypothetical protein
MAVVIFSIDDVSNPRTLRKFIKMVDDLKAVGKLQGDFVLTFGMWKGVMEQSFLMCEEDFYQYVWESDWVEDQEAFLIVEVGPKGNQSAYLLDSDRASAEYMGELKEVSFKEAAKHDGWTYRPDLNLYWIVEEE